MTRGEYNARVQAALRRVTERERAAIRAELDAHMEDHICDLLDLGYSPELAEERTMALMGDPEEVGRELNKQYPLGWLVAGRVAAALLACLGLIAMLMLPDTTREVWRNIMARTDPEQGVHYTFAGNYGEHIHTRDLDIRAAVGNDVLYIYRVGVMAFDADGRARATVWACNYDQNWLGKPSGMLLNDLRFTSETMEHREDLPLYERYGDWVNIRVTRADRYIVARYDKNGYDVRVEIPLFWEEWEADEAS